MDIIIIDWLSVLIAAILYMIIGALWYSPYFFGKLWMKYMKLTPKDMKGKSWRYVTGFICALILALFLSVLQAFLQANTTWDGIFVGIGVWIGFIATSHFALFQWSSKPWGLYWIDVGFFLVALIIMGGIIGA